MAQHLGELSRTALLELALSLVDANAGLRAENARLQARVDDVLQRNSELKALADARRVCTRTDGHTGACDGFPRWPGCYLSLARPETRG